MHIARSKARRSNASASRGLGWFPRFELGARGERDAVLVVAREPLLAAIVEHARLAHLECYTPATRLDAIRTLEKHGNRIAYAIVTSDPPWGFELRQLLAHDYPAIERIALVV
jgi:hypothetical protein